MTKKMMTRRDAITGQRALRVILIEQFGYSEDDGAVMALDRGIWEMRRAGDLDRKMSMRARQEKKRQKKNTADDANVSGAN
ncbi:MAG: hypothetical protein IJT82_03470 [Schwartzia sp.]|nr:hypothetical protein [Schwartzia sp. (in: firmicutes)]